MAGQEDCASVLEQFIYDGANLPAEISHMMEEIEAKDAEMQKHLTLINNKDTNLQKNIKANGVLQLHPKESEYYDQVKKHYDMVLKLQEQKMQLSERAAHIFDRQIKRFDTKIRDLATDGQLSMDGLPSTFNRKPDKPFTDVQGMPLQNASISALNANAHRMNSQQIAMLQARQNAQAAAALNNATAQRSVPVTPAVVQAQRQREREQSLGADNKRRKLGNPLVTNLPAQPSNLRQSSLGPGTPKAGTPVGGATGSRAGSVPRATAPAINAVVPKKSALSKKLNSAQALKLKNKHTKHARLSSVGRKKTQSPSGRGGRAGTAASEEESVLSSADASETDASQNRSRGGRKKKQAVKEEVVEEVDADPAEDNAYDEDDPNLYCLCQEKSSGGMVACDNDDCKYQWFHLSCVGLKKAPGDDDVWYCPECRSKPEIIQIMRSKVSHKKN